LGGIDEEGGEGRIGVGGCENERGRGERGEGRWVRRYVETWVEGWGKWERGSMKNEG